MNCEEPYFAKKTNRQPLYQLSVCFLYTILSFTKKELRVFVFHFSANRYAEHNERQNHYKTKVCLLEP